MDDFTSGRFDEINLLYTEFISAVTQRPIVERCCPWRSRPTGRGGRRGGGRGVHLRAQPGAVINILLPRYVETEVYGVLMEAKASELGARMTAMRNASDNADRDDRKADPQLQPGAAGRHHEGDFRDRRRRRSDRCRLAIGRAADRVRAELHGYPRWRR